MAWLVALCVAMWGPFSGLPQFACLRLSAPVRLSSLAAHAPDCRCAQCPGAKSCCCRPASSAAQTFRLMARCDRPQPVSFSATAKINPPLPPCFTAFSLLWTPVVAPQIHAKNANPRLSSSAPPTEPPRLA